MANTFSLILVMATLVTGLVWLLDRMLLAPRRQARVSAAEQQAGDALDPHAVAKLAAEPSWVETCKSLFPVIGAVLVLRSFIYEPFQIPSGSMMPTLLVGDFILVEKFAYGLKDPVFQHKLVSTGEPHRGDVVVFKYPPQPSVDYIKRVVGLPGDRIIYRDKTLYIKPQCSAAPCPGFAKVTDSLEAQGEFSQGPFPLSRFSEQLGPVNHQILVNPYLPDRVAQYYNQPGSQLDEWVVPEGHYFVMGDNRDNSQDSRFWGFVPERNLVGKAVAIWMSFEFEHAADSWLPSWVPTGIRLDRIGGIG